MALSQLTPCRTQVILSYTGDYFAISAQEMATGAIVYITEGSNIIPLRELKDGVYSTEG